ncbi:hypothetical protein GCK72_024337 [Caenorhabditis remanei]|uniref:Uncharacterized protein n=1 Tax=Caenorhabditis remanei TaxID=31234 RepID=A0A6A5FZG5_CAERE|nr:hypothetical protein GCK72_024337 [Caenorhabditis remanei]KAF1747871.1 hypothetical protein GCK72_024337 [Caenorhabditis remanei]
MYTIKERRKEKIKTKNNGLDGLQDNTKHLSVELGDGEWRRLEALAVDNGWAGLVVLLLGDPHLLEGGEGGKDGSSDPDGVLALWWGDDLDLHESLWATETLVSDGDDLSVRKFVGLLEGGGRSGGGHFLLEVEGDVAELLLDVTDDLTLGGGGERVTTLGKDLHEVVSKITSGKIETEDGVWEGISFVDWDGVGDTISRVEDDSGGTSGSVEGENGLDGDVHGWGVEGLEHDLGHLFSVGLWIERSFSEEDWMLFWSNTELIVEGVMPDLLHVIPVGDDSVFNWVLEGQDTSLGLGLVSDIGIFLSHTDHDSLMSWASNDGWEDGTWSIVSGESGLKMEVGEECPMYLHCKEKVAARICELAALLSRCYTASLAFNCSTAMRGRQQGEEGASPGTINNMMMLPLGNFIGHCLKKRNVNDDSDVWGIDVLFTNVFQLFLEIDPSGTETKNRMTSLHDHQKARCTMCMLSVLPPSAITKYLAAAIPRNRLRSAAPHLSPSPQNPRNFCYLPMCNALVAAVLLPPRMFRLHGSPAPLLTLFLITSLLFHWHGSK